MTIELSLFHLPLVVGFLVALWLTVKAIHSKERDPFYGLSMMLPMAGCVVFLALYISLYWWFRLVA